MPTSINRWVKGRLANPYSSSSMGGRARTRRFQRMLEKVPDFEDMHVVDLGGDVRSWQVAHARPAHVTIVDISPDALKDPEPWMTVVQGDACDRATISGSFDFVFSNSVIEHLGGPRYRRSFAEVVHDLAPYHWIQTPSRYFPLEPHLLFPGCQFLPPAAKVRLSRDWPLSARYKQDVDHVAYVMDHELLTLTEMQALFPASELIRERAAGLVKSLIATRHPALLPHTS
jgi:23S rRNA U2552 (ribose-2'-O)-methylase RlmE/FtsJ